MNESLGAEARALRERMASELHEIAQMVMPFGRFSGKKLHELPAEYLQWFESRGWPKGRLGELMRIVHQMKVDGSDIAFDAYRIPQHRRKKAD